MLSVHVAHVQQRRIGQKVNELLLKVEHLNVDPSASRKSHFLWGRSKMFRVENVSQLRHHCIPSCHACVGGVIPYIRIPAREVNHPLHQIVEQLQSISPVR